MTHHPRTAALAALAGAGMFVFGIVMALVGAVVPSLSVTLPIGLADVGTIFLVMNVAMLLASLTLGLVVDRHGLKTPLAVGVCIVAVGLLFIARATTFTAVLAGAACLGLGGGALNGAANTLTADLYEDDRRKAAALNLLGVWFGFGAVVLPFTMAALSARFGVSRLLAAAASICVAIGIASTALPFPAPKARHGWPLAELSRFARVPLVVTLGLLLFLQSGNEFLLGGYFSAFLTRELDVSIESASYRLAGYWAAIMAARAVMSRVLLHISAHAVIVAGAFLSASGAIVVGTAQSAAVASAGMLLTGFALAGIFPTVLGLAGSRFAGHSGTVFGLLFTLALCGGIAVPSVAGYLADAAGLRWVFALAAASFVGIACLGLIAHRTMLQRSAAVTSADG